MLIFFNAFVKTIEIIIEIIVSNVLKYINNNLNSCYFYLKNAHNESKGERAMAKCPKCNARLHIYNVSQFCPKCGTNMRYVNFEENFLREAKIAELTQATVHVKVRRLKAAFVGGKLQILRLVFMLLPVAALLIPNGSFTIDLPYYSHSVSFSVLGLYSVFTNGDFDYINAMCSSELFGEAFRELRTVIFLYALPVVFAIITLFTCLLCFISIKNMQKVICGAAACGAVSSIVSMVLIGRFSAAFSDSALLSASNGFGLIAAVLMFGVVIIVNALMQKKGIRVEYDEGMEERVAIYRKYKRGEVKIDDLPQPVVETEATRKIDEEIAKEEALFREKAEKEEVEV